LNPTSTTPPCYNNTILGNQLYAWREGPNVTNPVCWTCELLTSAGPVNCSHECAAELVSEEVMWIVIT